MAGERYMVMARMTLMDSVAAIQITYPNRFRDDEIDLVLDWFALLQRQMTRSVYHAGGRVLTAADLGIE